MIVHFQKLNNGDWICYDSLNTTGDLFVDPAKIHLLTDMLTPGIQFEDYHCYDLKQTVEIKFFGRVEAELVLRVNDNGTIRDVEVAFDKAFIEHVTFDNLFVLELPAIPAFDNYKYIDSDEV